MRVRLLGGLEVRRDGELVPPLESARAESLLAYLVLHAGKPQPRQQLAFLLWPDSTEPQARTNLRHVLHTLRRGLPEADGFLEAAPRTLIWRADGPWTLDVAAFQESLDRAERGPAAGRLPALREAVALYTGDLLDGRYDAWLLEERDRLRQRYLDALDQLAELSGAAGDHATAIEHAERLVREDPLREAAYRLLIRLYDARGDRARALRAYHRCATALERELGVTPAAATRELYESLLPAVPEVAPPPGPPLIGRAAERSRLIATWQALAPRGPQLVLVTGEPGIGKTRLVEEYARWCHHRGAAVAETRCYPAEVMLAYAPVAAWLRSAAIRLSLDRLEPARLGELARLLPELLTEVPGLAPPPQLLETEQRHRLYDALVAAIRLAGEPLLLVLDDLQWCDQHSLRFLHYLLRPRPGGKLLVAATARLEELPDRHPFHQIRNDLRVRDQLTELELPRLTPAETASLGSGLSGGTLAAAASRRLYGETEGNPLFVVETVRAGRSSPRVQAVIEARLGTLSDSARQLAGLAAVIGRQFTSGVLAVASDADEAELVSDLDELWRRRIIREQGPDGYDFSHERLREVAYQGLSPVRRRRHHRRIAEALRGTAEPPAAQVAHHYEQAGAVLEAVDRYAEAARAAQLLHANTEAVRLLNRALDVLRTRHVSADRNGRELELLTMLLAPLGAIEGYGSARTHTVQRRALELARTLGDEPAPPLLRSLAFRALIRGEFEVARRYGGQLLAHGERDRDEMVVVEATYLLGITAFWQGRFDTARDHFQLAVTRYRPEQRQAHLLRYGQDPKVVCLSRLGNTLWFLGDREGAVAARDAAVALAEELGHPFSRDVALVFASLLALDMGDEPGLRDYASKLGASAHLARPTLAVAAALRGYLRVLDGDPAGGLRRIRDAVEDTSGDPSAPGMVAGLLRILLAGYQAAGDAANCVQTAERLLAAAHGAVWESEARRVLSAFLIRPG